LVVLVRARRALTPATRRGRTATCHHDHATTSGQLRPNLGSDQRLAGAALRASDTRRRAMSESIENNPVAEDDVEAVVASEESDEEAARSLPAEGSDDDPGSMINR